LADWRRVKFSKVPDGDSAGSDWRMIGRLYMN
jgi:hypothetical protein